MTANEAFEHGWKFVQRWEGGYVNDPADPGGETKYGISKRAHPEVNIKDLTLEQAAQIYRKDYWDALKLDQLVETRPLFAITVFDAAVNLGPLQARKLAQKAAGATPDGIWGPLTRKAFRERSDMVLVEMMCFYRRQYYREIVLNKPAMGKFIKGWLRRVEALQQYVRTVEV